MIGWWLVLLAMTVVAPVQAQSDAWVRIEGPDGSPILGFRPQSKPYTGEEEPRVGSHFPDRQPTDTKGRVISGVGFYGWESEGTIHVVVLILVPDADAENRFYPDAEDRRLHYEELSRMALRRGETRQTDELTALYGGRVMTVRIATADRPALRLDTASNAVVP